MGVIFFNVKEAREHLLSTGVVYTLRQLRSTGKSTAVTGSRYKHKSLARVLVELVKTNPSSEDCEKYLSQSGFSRVEDWWDKAILLYIVKKGLTSADLLDSTK